MIYDNLKKNINNISEIQNKVVIHFVRGAFVEVNGLKKADYKVDFINQKTNQIMYSSTIQNNMWTKCSVEYFVDWKIVIYENGKLWKEHYYDARGKRVYVALDSKALGDSLAWFPYVEEFRKKYDCEMVTSTFMNHMFVEQYPNIEFVEPGVSVENLYAMYSIGLFYNEDSVINGLKNPSDPKHQTMQKMCSDILGLDFVEVKPLIKKRVIEKPQQKQITIAIHGTAQPKYWNNPFGWQEVVDWLNGMNFYIQSLFHRESIFSLVFFS